MKTPVRSLASKRNLVSSRTLLPKTELPTIIPICMIDFDNAYASIYTVAYPYMKARGLRGTIYINTDTIGTADHMTEAQLLEVYADGWAIGNHSTDHSDLTLLNQAEIASKLSPVTDYILGLDMPRAAYCVAYPYGYYNADVLEVMSTLAMQTGRKTGSALITPSINDIYEIPSFMSVATNATSVLTGYIDDAISNNKSVDVLFHNLLATATSSNYWIARFQEFIDYVVSTGINVVTIDEYYNSLL